MENKYKKTYLEGIVLGAFLTSIFFFIAFQLLDLNFGENSILVITSMMSIMGSLVGVLIAGWYILKQIQANTDVVQETRDRELIAVKAVLPLALNDFIDVCMYNVARFFSEAEIQGVNVDLDVNCIKEVKSDSIQIIQGCIVSANNQDSEILARILCDYQACIARSKRNFTDKIEKIAKIWQHNSMK